MSHFFGLSGRPRKAEVDAHHRRNAARRIKAGINLVAVALLLFGSCAMFTPSRSLAGAEPLDQDRATSRLGTAALNEAVGLIDATSRLTANAVDAIAAFFHSLFARPPSEPNLVVEPPSRESELDAPGAGDVEATDDQDTSFDPASTGAPGIIERIIERQTPVTYVTNPTAVVRETVHTSGGGNVIDPSAFVARSLFDAQVDAFYNSLTSSTDGLGESFGTDLLTVSGNASIGGILSVAGVSGLTDADIPDGLTASNYLPLTGGTLTGSLTGDLTVASSTSTFKVTLDGSSALLALTASTTAGLSAPNNLLQLRNTNTTLGAYAGILFQTNEGDDNRRAQIVSGAESTANVDGLGSGRGYIAFVTRVTGGTSGFTHGFSESMRVSSQGKVGIGTTSPFAWLDIFGKRGNTASFQNSPLLQLSTVNPQASYTTTTQFIVTNAGNVGIGTTTPWRTLSVTGTVGFDGLTGNFGTGSLCLDANKQVVYNAGSDACLSSLRSTKHAIAPLDLDALAAIIALHPVSFVYNGDASSTVRYGFIADDTEVIDRSLATHDAHGDVSGIDDRAILSVVVKAVQEILAKIAGFAESMTTQTLTAEVGRVQELCVGSICVTETELRALLDREHVTTSPPPISAPPTEPSADQIDDPEAPEPETEVLDVDATSKAPEEDPAGQNELPLGSEGADEASAPEPEQTTDVPTGNAVDSMI